MSPKLPRITSAQLRRALKRDGWEIVRQSGSHAILKHPKKPGRVTLPIHATVAMKMKTLATILEQAELTVDELQELL
jgi:predicted RNA binding protein YcfA (HicA-like mRNA interferase family)